MDWIFFAIACAVFVSAASLVEKRGLQKVHATDFSVSVSLVNIIFSLPFLFFVDWQALTLEVFGLIFCTAFFAATAFFLVAKAIRHIDISDASPLLSLSPASTSLFAFVILGESLEWVQVGGIGFMVLGSFILALHPHTPVRESLRVFGTSRYIQFLFVSLLFYSMGAIFDRAILSDFAVPVATYMVFFHIFMALLYIPLVFAFGGGVRGIGAAFGLASLDIVLTSLFTVLYRFFQMEAISLAYVGLVSAIKRSSSFFTTLIGGELFHEKYLARKLSASAVIIFGILCVVL
jgi:drug/metabolite transporter (DMT)-like permease